MSHVRTALIHRITALALAIFAGAGVVSAHPGSLNLFVDEHDRIYAWPIFDLPQLVKYFDAEISIDGPGFGISFLSNGVQPGTSFSVDVVSDLLYWDGFGMAPTTAVLQMDAPIWDNQGSLIHSPVDQYWVNSQSGFQTGMTWGTYNGSNFWEAHALNFLWPLDAAPGVYGVVLRLNANLHQSSPLFVIPLVYDPHNAWNGTQETKGANRLRDATTALPIADINRDGRVNKDDVDALVAEMAAGSNNLEFDLNQDNVVDQNDLTEWLLRAGHVKLPLLTSFLRGDANLDGIVDGQDFIAWNNSKFTATAAWSRGDFNGDGVVDGQDFILWNTNKFAVADGNLPVPEPMNALVSITFVSTLLFMSRWQRTL